MHFCSISNNANSLQINYFLLINRYPCIGISSKGEALSNGEDKQTVRVKTASGKIVSGTARSTDSQFLILKRPTRIYFTSTD